MSINIQSLNKESFAQLVEESKSGKPVLIDFWATWCGPCKAMAPHLQEFADENAEKLVVTKVDVDEEPELAASMNVRAMPTITLIKGGEVVAMNVGSMSKLDLAGFVQPHLTSN